MGSRKQENNPDKKVKGREKSYPKNLAPFKTIKGALHNLGKGFRMSSTSAIQFELRELENIFCLLILASFAGIPSPPGFLSLSLLPHLERELKVMLSRSKNIDDPIGDLFSVFNIG